MMHKKHGSLFLCFQLDEDCELHLYCNRPFAAEIISLIIVGF